MDDVRDALMIGRDSQGRTINRPLSPHLQVYRFQISMASSILNRITGTILGAGALLLTWWLVAAATSPHAWAIVRAFTLSPVGLLLLLGWLASLAYHTLAGIRHLAWDAGYGFAKPTANRTGWTVIALTALLTLVVAAIGIAGWQ